MPFLTLSTFLKMKTKIILFILFLHTTTTWSQLANAVYTVRFHSITSKEDGGSNNCWEVGEEEYTLAFAGFNDNITTSNTQTGCFTCERNGDCTYGSLTTIGTRTNQSNVIYANIDAFESDGNPRCTYLSGDDCRWNGNVSSVRYREGASPSNGTYTNWNFSNSNHSLTYSYTWRYTGSANSITPTCVMQSTSYSSGNINSWSVYLTAGLTYEFTTCGSSTSDDTYLRLYGTDGYTIVAFNDDNSTYCPSSSTKSYINYTATTTGWHYIELSRFTRSANNVAGQLFYRVTNDYPAQPSAISGTTTICAGSSSSLSVTNVGGVTYTWSYSGSGTLSGGTGNTQTITPTAGGTITVTPSNACGSGTSRTAAITVNTLSSAPTNLSSGTNVCKGSTTTLSVSGASLGTGAQYQWYSGSCGGALLGTTSTTTFNVTPNNFGNNTYFVRASGTCNTTTCATVNINIPTPTTLSANNDAATCLTNGSQYVEFTNGTRAILSINPNGTNLGNVTVTSYVDAAPLNIQDCNATQPWFNTATLQRHYLVIPTNNATGSYNVRLYLSQLEFNALSAVSTSNQNTNDNVGNISDLKLTKYNGLNEDNTFSNNCGNGTFTLYPQNTSGSITSFISGFDANGRYVEFIIPSFSELWLHGSSDNSPLPVELISFKAYCDENKVYVDWKTASEQNNAFFIIEKSTDMVSWQEVGRVSGAGNSNTIKSYGLEDFATSANAYYRIHQQDFDGTKVVFNPISVHCLDFVNNDQIKVFPNPSTNDFTIQIITEKSYGKATIQLIDQNGRVVNENKVFIEEGINNFLYKTDAVSAGTLSINVLSEYIALPKIKVVILK